MSDGILIEILEKAEGVMEPIAELDWHEKWRCQRVHKHIADALAIIRDQSSEISGVIEDEAILNTLGDLKEPWDALRPYINDTPELVSLLYDLGLMPEQIHVRSNFVRMLQLAEWHKGVRSPKREAQPCEMLLLSPDMSAQELRLHMGEMTAQEERTARAAIRWANSVAKGNPPY